MPENRFHVFVRDLSGHIFGIIDGAVMGLKDILANTLKTKGEIFGVAGEIHTGLLSGERISFGFVK
jgi:hypothetical protein